MMRSNGNDGFTLIEVLVAFIVMALLMVAVQRAVVTSVDGTARADMRIRLEMVARSLMTGPLGSGTDAIAAKSGSMDGLNWSLRFQSVNLPFPPAPAGQAKTGWIPIRMIVRVSSATPPASDLTIATVRLVNLAAQ